MAPALALGACSKAQLVRFAPPGIIKYEELAGDQPPSPQIQERIAERREEARPRFPNLSETPSAPPEVAPESEQLILTEDLETAAQTLQTAIADARLAAKEEERARDALPVARDQLLADIDRDAAAAERERAALDAAERKNQ